MGAQRVREQRSDKAAADSHGHNRSGSCCDDAALRWIDRAPSPQAVTLLRAARASAPSGIEDAPAAAASVRSVTGGGGRPLDGTTRARMEGGFGADFSTVRIHDDATATASARAMHADAYTFGEHIVLPGGATGAGAPRTLAHELVHVIQQRNGPVDGRPFASGLGVSDPSDRFEQEAEAVAARVSAGGSTGMARPGGASGAGAGGVVARKAVVQRHNSDEHYLLGQLTPDQIGKLADGRVESDARIADASKVEKVKSLFGGTRQKNAKAVNDALHVINAELDILSRLKEGDGPSADEVDAHTKKRSGETAVVGGVPVELPGWDRQWVLIHAANGDVPASIGDLNALPDFVGNLEDLRAARMSVVFRILQVIRREAYIGLMKMKTGFLGKEYKFDTSAKKNDFFGIEGMASGTPRALGDMRDVGDFDRITQGKTAGGEKRTGTTQGVSESKGEAAALGRNACHFPPESWLRWKQMHTEARAKIAAATTDQQLTTAANDAVALNSFGEHYLQDSYAAGHLINKGFIMAVAMEHASYATLKLRGMTTTKIQHVQDTLAHRDAYSAPRKGQNVVEARAEKEDAKDLKKQAGNDPLKQYRARQAKQRAKNKLDAASDEFANIGSGRDAQTAYDAGVAAHKATGGNAAAKDTAAKDAEIRAAGLDPNIISWDEYRTFLNDLWFQTMTNVLHNEFCEKGLIVGSPDKAVVGRIYGDANMLKGQREAVEYTAETSQMSREAINELIDNKRATLAHLPKPHPGGVWTVDAIMARFPDTVYDGNGANPVSLVEWATGQSARRMVDQVLSKNPMVKEFRGGGSAKSRFAAAGSSVMGVASGLSAAHGQF